MKKPVRTLCVTLLLSVLLAGCTPSAHKKPSDSQNPAPPIAHTSVPHADRSDPAEDSSVSVEGTSVPEESLFVPVESSVVPEESSVVPAERSSVPVETSFVPEESSVGAAAESGMYILVNNTRVAPGMKFADVKDGLGGKAAPDQELGGCDGSCFGWVHFYPGLTVTENPDGLISGIELNRLFGGETEAALLGRVRPGTGLDDALAALGRPENAETIATDCMLTYEPDGMYVFVLLDPENQNTVSAISLTLR